MNIQVLNELCRDLCEAVEPARRARAEQTLSQLADSADALQLCTQLLQSGQMPYSAMVASSTLQKLLNSKAGITVQQREDLCNYVLGWLYERAGTSAGLPQYVVTSMAQLWARITKLEWLHAVEKDAANDSGAANSEMNGDGEGRSSQISVDSRSWQEPLDDLVYPFQKNTTTIIESIKTEFPSSANGLLSMQLITLLIGDMNTTTGHESLARARRTAADFRDSHLLELFETAMKHLQTALDKGGLEQQLQSDRSVASALHSLLELAHATLSFDFTGSSTDETAEDAYSIQLPCAWRPTMMEGKALDTVFRLYRALPPRYTAKILSIATLIFSVRRTLFSALERTVLLERGLEGLSDVLKHPDKLMGDSESGNAAVATTGDSRTGRGSSSTAVHELCRIISRLKDNFQLAEMIKWSGYSELIRLLASFTAEGFNMVEEFPPNSLYFLTRFWSKMVGSISYVHQSDESKHELGTLCPPLIELWVRSRLAHVEHWLREQRDNPLDEHGELLQTLEHVAVMLRCDYNTSARLLMEHFDQQFAALATATQNGDRTQQAFARERLAWMTILIGAALHGKSSVSQYEKEQDVLDAQLIARALQYMKLSDERLATSAPTNAGAGSAPQRPSEGDVHTEKAFLLTLDNFRKVYINDNMLRTDDIYAEMAKLVGVDNDADMLLIYVRKIITNLKWWAAEPEVVEMSLSLFRELSLGYGAARRLMQLEDIRLLIGKHTEAGFGFLAPGLSFTAQRIRTTFYEALTRLLEVDMSDQEATFTQYMQPLEATLNSICAGVERRAAGSEQQLQLALAGLCRDLRGVALGLNRKENFELLLNWLLGSSFFALTVRAVELWPDMTALHTAILRFLTELVQNRQQRLKFEMFSCHVVLLFREFSKYFTTYGSRIVTLPRVSPTDEYALRFKQIGLLFEALRLTLAGSYVPFGVLRLYGDTSLSDALAVFIRLVHYMNTNELQSYGKLAQSYYHLLESLAQDHLLFFTRLEPSLFLQLLRSLQVGIAHHDAIIVTSACSTLDHILNYLYKKLTRPSQAQVPGTPTSAASGAQQQQQQQQRSLLNAGDNASTPSTSSAALKASRLFQEPEGDAMIRAVQQDSRQLADLLTSILADVVYNELRCQWSVSRPLLTLILLQPDIYGEFKRRSVEQQPPERRELFEKLWSELMDGVEPSVAVKNKDQFTQNVSRFRRLAQDVLRGRPETVAQIQQEMKRRVDEAEVFM